MKKVVFLSLLAFVLAGCLGPVNVTTIPDSQVSGYKIGPEDILKISVWGDEELSPEVIVRPDGKISMPLVGEIQASGRTTEEIRQEIEDKVKTYVPDSPVTVMLLEIKSPKVYVSGKVKRPGMYIMVHPMTITQALALAGGFDTFAEKTHVLLVRDQDGKQLTHEYDFDEVSRGIDLEQNIMLKPNDTIVVP